MAKKEKEMPKEQIITLFDKEYKESELSDEQKVMINHVADLERKIQSSEFNLQQLRFGKQAFLDALQVSVSEEDEPDDKGCDHQPLSLGPMGFTCRLIHVSHVVTLQLQLLLNLRDNCLSRWTKGSNFHAKTEIK